MIPSFSITIQPGDWMEEQLPSSERAGQSKNSLFMKSLHLLWIFYKYICVKIKVTFHYMVNFH